MGCSSTQNALTASYAYNNVTGPGKPVLSTQNTPIHIMVSISFYVCAIQSL